jgi:2-polyprenyl-3-methyl-5-hydroxy-6-metoxy-1,4-benzoquinol methylase
MTGHPRIATRARELVHRLDDRRVPQSLKERWVHGEERNEEWVARLRRDRVEIIPWLDRTRALAGSAIVEIGCGEGVSTVALAEQGALVTAIDIDPGSVAAARDRLHSRGLDAHLECANAADLQSSDVGNVEWIIFWASLEHMLHDERIAALNQAWSLLPRNGLLTVIETPNRLWPYDSHTSRLPYFSWLPDEVAFAVAPTSPRPHFGGDHYHDAEAQLTDFLRRGRGVSFHEFDLAIGDHRDLPVRSCMQLDLRARNPIRRIGWYLSKDGRTEKMLRRFDPRTHRAWYQPFLYLTLEKRDQHNSSVAKRDA